MSQPDYATEGGVYLYHRELLDMGQKNVVIIKMTGERDKDFLQANIEAGFSEFGYKAPSIIISGEKVPFTWHHLDDFNSKTDECTMQLVRSDAHTRAEGMAHTDACAQFRNYFGYGY